MRDIQGNLREVADAKALEGHVGYGRIASVFGENGRPIGRFEKLPRRRVAGNAQLAQEIPGLEKALQDPLVVNQNGMGISDGVQVLRNLYYCSVLRLGEVCIHVDRDTPVEAVVEALSAADALYPGRAWQAQMMGASGVSNPGDGRYAIASANVQKLFDAIAQLPHMDITLVAADILREKENHVEAAFLYFGKDGEMRAAPLDNTDRWVQGIQADLVSTALSNAMVSRGGMRPIALTHCVLEGEGVDARFPLVMDSGRAMRFWEEYYSKNVRSHALQHFYNSGDETTVAALQALHAAYLPVFGQVVEALSHKVVAEAGVDASALARVVTAIMEGHDDYRHGESIKFSVAPLAQVAESSGKGNAKAVLCSALRRLGPQGVGDGNNEQTVRNICEVLGESDAALVYHAALVVAVAQSLPVYLSADGQNPNAGIVEYAPNLIAWSSEENRLMPMKNLHAQMVREIEAPGRIHALLGLEPPSRAPGL